MSIHAPGRIDRGKLGWRRGGLGGAIARALPSSAPLGAGRRKVIASISMTSMIDVLVVMTVFLLLTFQSSEQCGMTDLSKVPVADNVMDAIDAPMVHVGASGDVLLNGSLVTTRAELEASHGRVARLDGLFNSLRQQYELKKQLRPDALPNEHVLLAIEGDVPAYVVKSIVLTASRSGYPSIDFMVHAAPKG